MNQHSTLLLILCFIKSFEAGTTVICPSSDVYHRINRVVIHLYNLWIELVKLYITCYQLSLAVGSVLR